jgi:hypothetical protein
MAETDDAPASPERVQEALTGSAGGFERLPIEVQALSAPSDGGPSAAFIQAATPAAASAPETPAGES